MVERVFSIAKDFSPNPGPRHKWQGPNSGESLRPKLKKLLAESKGTITVVLDGTRGMGSSFLDEAFGGLIRYEGCRQNDLESRFYFVSHTDPSYVRTIRDSFNRAEREIANAN